MLTKRHAQRFIPPPPSAYLEQSPSCRVNVVQFNGAPFIYGLESVIPGMYGISVYSVIETVRCEIYYLNLSSHKDKESKNA